MVKTRIVGNYAEKSLEGECCNKMAKSMPKDSREGPRLVVITMAYGARPEDTLGM